MRGRDIRRALHEGTRIYATAVTAPAPGFPEALRQARADFVFIDTEHTPIGRETLAWMCRTYQAMGIPPVVRIPSPDAVEAAKVLDGGAGGLIGPYVETADQVRELAGAARYRPLKGRRLQEALQDAGTLEPELRGYLESRNQDTVLIVNIESVPAIENLDEVLAVPGLDAVLIGPHDLSCSLGIPEQYQHPRFHEAVKTIFRMARSKGIGAGIHYWEGIDQEVAYAQAGANLIMHSADVTMFRQHLPHDLEALRSALGDTRGGTEASGEVV